VRVCVPEFATNGFNKTEIQPKKNFWIMNSQSLFSCFLRHGFVEFGPNIIRNIDSKSRKWVCCFKWLLFCFVLRCSALRRLEDFRFEGLSSRWRTSSLALNSRSIGRQELGAFLRSSLSFTPGPGVLFNGRTRKFWWWTRRRFMNLLGHCASWRGFLLLMVWLERRLSKSFGVISLHKKTKEGKKSTKRNPIYREKKIDITFALKSCVKWGLQ
jgi:hypothetical protein